MAGDSPGLIPAAAKEQEPSKVSVTVRFVPARPRWSPNRLIRRISAYLSRLPNLGEGQGRDDIAYGLACWLLRDLGLSDDAALPWLEQWDQGNSPPKGTQRLKEIMTSARRYGQHVVNCDSEGGIQ